MTESLPYAPDNLGTIPMDFGGGLPSSVGVLLQQEEQQLGTSPSPSPLPEKPEDGQKPLKPLGGNGRLGKVEEGDGDPKTTDVKASVPAEQA